MDKNTEQLQITDKVRTPNQHTRFIRSTGLSASTNPYSEGIAGDFDSSPRYFPMHDITCKCGKCLDQLTSCACPLCSAIAEVSKSEQT